MSDYKEIAIDKAKIGNDDWLKIISKKFSDREPYEQKQNQLKISTVTGRILGIPDDELSYFQNLFRLYESADVKVLNDIVKEKIPAIDISRLLKILDEARDSVAMTMDSFVGLLGEEGLLIQHENPALNNLLYQSMVKVLETYKNKHIHIFEEPEFQYVLRDLLNWNKNFLSPWLNQYDIETEMPHIVWYGDASKGHLYFLYYLMLIGCDVLIFHPQGKDQFADIDPEENTSFIYWFPASMDIEPLKSNGPERLETVAYRSSKQLDVVLRQHESQIYKAWQFVDYLPKPVTLRTTFDELFLLAKEKAFIRPGFNAGEMQIDIPNIFAKINGVSSNRRDYWKQIHKLMEFEQTKVIRHFPFSEEEDVDYTIHYMDTLDKDGNINPEKLMQSAIWLYKHLPQGRQRAIAHAISRLCAKPKLIPKENESQDDIRLYLFTQSTNLTEEGLRWIQSFDYSQTVPKLILFHTEKNGQLVRSDAAKLLLLNELGFDIFLYNPTGYASIENYIDEDSFDIHLLDEMVFEQKFKRPSVFRKMFQSKK